MTDDELLCKIRDQLKNRLIEELLRNEFEPKRYQRDWTGWVAPYLDTLKTIALRKIAVGFDE